MRIKWTAKVFHHHSDHVGIDIVGDHQFNLLWKGTYNYADGERYEGDWKHGEKHGQGIYHYTDGAR